MPEETADAAAADAAVAPGRAERHLTRTPALVGVVLLVAAAGWTLAADDLGFPGFLLMILGGWCLGFAFVNTVFAMQPVRLGVMLHIGVAVALGLAMYAMIEHGSRLVDGLPEQARAPILVLQIAAGPAAGWIWLGLLSRLADVFTRRDRARRPTPTTPTWEREPDGDGSGVRFSALPLRMSTITRATVVMVVVLGAAGVALLIALDDLVMRLGARVAIIALGILIAFPAYLGVLAVVRRRTLRCTLAFGNDEVRVVAGARTHVIPFRELDALVWRRGTDYARVEVRVDGVDLSLVVGLAKPARGRTPELPELPRRVFRRLELAGMSVERSRRDEIVTFRRAS
ncbi:hypothetical protein [Microbacterium maritypicum]